MPRLSIRPATPHDYDAFTRLFPELAVYDPVPTRERFESAIMPDTVFAQLDSAPAGLAWSRRRGEALHVVYLIVAPAARRAGVGRALMTAVSARGRALGLSRWMLNVKPDNVAARALYERCGMSVTAESASVRLAWSDVAKLPSPPDRVLVGPIDDEARFEHALRMSNGELAALRALPGRVFFGAEMREQVVGVAAFDAAFPGVSPLRVLTPLVARPLFEAARAHALEGQAHFVAFVEGDPALVEALGAAGGEVVMRALRMEGVLVP